MGVAGGDDRGPLNAGFGGDEAALPVEGEDRIVTTEIDEPGVGAELLATHGVASAAEGKRGIGGVGLADEGDDFAESTGLDDARDARGVERGVEVVDEERIGVRG
jgi:hypothetical protein